MPIIFEFVYFEMLIASFNALSECFEPSSGTNILEIDLLGILVGFRIFSPCFN